MALDQTLGTVQAPVEGSAHQPGWFGMNSAMHTHLQAVSEKLPAGGGGVGMGRGMWGVEIVQSLLKPASGWDQSRAFGQRCFHVHSTKTAGLSVAVLPS